jgi:hypothetical protein
MEERAELAGRRVLAPVVAMETLEGSAGAGAWAGG